MLRFAGNRTRLAIVSIALAGCSKVLGLDGYAELPNNSGVLPSPNTGGTESGAGVGIDGTGAMRGNPTGGVPSSGGSAGSVSIVGSGAPSVELGMGGSKSIGGTPNASAGGTDAQGGMTSTAGGGLGAHSEDPRCGNGRIDQVSEECDDANQVDGDSCTNACTVNCGAHPGNVVQLPTDYHCYSWFDTRTNFADAQSACEALGGALATVTTPAENALLGLYPIGSSWLLATDGLSPDVALPGQYRWLSDEQWTFQNWRMGQPSGYATVCGNSTCYEHCLVLEPGGTWNDVLCTDPFFVHICEWPPVGTFALPPYSGSPLVVAANTELRPEDFDQGGEGRAYHDTEPANQGGGYREEGVDIAPSTEGGWKVEFFGAGEWMSYTINVASAGSYSVVLRASNGSASAASVHLEVGPIGQIGGQGVLASSPLVIPPTGGAEVYQDVAVQMSLTQGVQWLRVAADTGSADISKLTFR